MKKPKSKPYILTTTRMSTRGQVVIPEKIRKAVGWKTSDQIIVTFDKDEGLILLTKARGCRR